MLVVLDVGNSNMVMGVFDGDTFRGPWRLMTSEHRTSDEMRVVMLSLLRLEGIDPDAVTGCGISSVVPPINHALDQACREAFHVQPLFVGPGVRTGLVIQVENPKEVGADRIVNAVGAMAAYPGPLIIIDFGTATTLDAITEKGEYRGGVIVPGVQISADALFERCAKLPHVEISVPEHVIGRNTVNHIRSGLTYGYADLVDGLVGRISEEMDLGGHDRPTVVATGGLAPLISGIARRIDHVDLLLTLNGLRIVFQKNAKEPGA